MEVYGVILRVDSTFRMVFPEIAENIHVDSKDVDSMFEKAVVHLNKMFKMKDYLINPQSFYQVKREYYKSAVAIFRIPFKRRKVQKERVHITLPTDMKARVVEIAAHSDKTNSEVIADMILRHID